MAYELFASEEARDELWVLPDVERRKIGFRLQLLQLKFPGDIEELEAGRSHYRLRVGNCRIPLQLIENRIEVML